MNHQRLLDDFELYLKNSGKAPETVRVCMRVVRAFLKHIGDTRLDRLGEDLTRSFFAGHQVGGTRASYAWMVSQFLKFAVARLPVPVTARGSEMAPAAAVKSKNEVALRQQWSLDKLLDQKENADAYSRGAYPAVLKAMANVIEGTPEVQTSEVANSTWHKIAAHQEGCSQK